MIKSRDNGHIAQVGTEEGRSHKCSKAYNSQYLIKLMTK